MELSTDRWELLPENIEQVSADIAFYKPITKNSYYSSTCLDCYHKEPHAPHPTPSTLYENFSDAQQAVAHLNHLHDEYPRYHTQKRATVEFQLEKFGKAKTLEEIETLNDQEKAIRDEIQDLTAQWQARTLRNRDFIDKSKKVHAVEDQRVKSLQHAKAKHEKLKGEFGKWFDENEEWYNVEYDKLGESIQKCSDHLAVLNDLIDEDILWYRDQNWVD